MVEAPAQGNDPSTTDATVGRFEAHNAAERRRVAYGPARAAAGGEAPHMCRRGWARAGARPAWKHGRIPRIARVAKYLHTAGGKFDGVEFAEADGTGLPQ